MSTKAKTSKSRSKAPTHAPATSTTTEADVHSEQTAAATANGATATPPDESASGGTNTAPADGGGSEASATNGHDQAGAGAATAPADNAAGDEAGAGVPADWLVDEEAFRETHPLTSAVIDAHGSGEPTLRVTAKIAGFRRGGIAHPAEAVDYPLLSLKPDQVEAILAEPQLVVELLY